ncbi:hypothetical protein [Pseudomonas psychrophila]|uniref:Uncharacterized protein n=1 Tax=Pseudomonas psychrophila TaxID=122355 RepID=A0A8I1FYF5_9PSED|nr:hypothetical protein [Pseudomonas psychrophila]AVX93250.1 hypothetical protein PkP19E3_34510 [Pseudomonas koreensis]MBJ2259196.1 hypothetical protein [Pseudomonas psychrophila]
MTTATNEHESFSGRLIDGFVAITVVLNRLWLALVAVPAGVVLTVLLVANDFSPTKVIESVMVISYETIQNLQPGTVVGTYRWTECVDSRPSEKLIAPVPKDQCNNFVSREGSLIEAIHGAALMGNFYFMVLLFFVAQLFVWPSSRFGVRSKLARLVRLNRS